MKTIFKIIVFSFFCLVIGLLCSCSKYTSLTFPFKDWSNPDSVMRSYETVLNSSIDTSNYVFRFWIDQSSTIKQYVEIIDSSGIFVCRKHKFGHTYNKKNKTKEISKIQNFTPMNDLGKIVDKVDSLELMNLKSRYHSWKTDGGPMHTPMVWYKIEYKRNNNYNSFIFWRFAGEKLTDGLNEYKPILNLIHEEFFNIKNN